MRETREEVEYMVNGKAVCPEDLPAELVELLLLSSTTPPKILGGGVDCRRGGRTPPS